MGTRGTRAPNWDYLGHVGRLRLCHYLIFVAVVFISCRKDEEAPIESPPAPIAPVPHHQIIEDLNMWGSRSAFLNSDGSISICASPSVYLPASFTLLNFNGSGGLNWRTDHPVDPITQVSAIAEVPGDGWLVVGGTTMNYDTQAEDIIVFKLDGAGGLEWTRTYGDQNGESASQIIRTNDGNFVIGGTRSHHGYLLKIAVNGDTLWTRTWSGPVRYINHLLELQNGDLLVSESFAPDGITQSDAFVARLSSVGLMIWEHSYETAVGRSALVALETSTGDLLVGGRGHLQGLVFKLNANGTLLWERTISPQTQYLDLDIISMAQLADGSLAMSGTATAYLGHTGTPRSDLLVARMTLDGDVVWVQTTFGDTNREESGKVLFVEPTDSMIVMGNYYAGSLSTMAIHLTRLGPDGGFE